MWFYLPVYSVPAPPSGPYVDFNNTQLLLDTLVWTQLVTGCSQSTSVWEIQQCRWKASVRGLFNLPHHFYSQDNWVILTNPAQELSGSMEMFSVWVLIFSATFLLRDSMTVWRQPQPWGRVDLELWRHFLSDEENIPTQLYSTPLQPTVCFYVPLHIKQWNASWLFHMNTFMKKDLWWGIAGI